MKNKIIIIAEAGGNHNGSIKNAYKLIDIAKKAGADYIKFQTFTAETLVSKDAPKAKYQKKNVKNISHYEMIKKLEMSYEMHVKLIKYCKQKKIKFLSSPFSIESFNLLRNFKLDYIKIPSGEITNLPFLRHVSKFKNNIILSTGMSNTNEIKETLKILKKKSRKIILLHCNTEYPTPQEDINLNAMIELKNTFNIDVGYSDHSLGAHVPIVAASLGAKIIEKHFTISKKMSGPDHIASLNPKELITMIKAVRATEIILGKNKKFVSKSEKKNIRIARKSLFAKINIEKGEKFSPQNLICLRPGTGISPMKIDTVFKKRAKKNFSKGQIIKI
jgi:N,N'-diacetyllegionaminate synthase